MTGYIGAIEKQTRENTYFRQVLFTAQHAQLVVMCLRPGEEIGDEVHSNVDRSSASSRGMPSSSLAKRRNARCTTGMRSWFRQGRTTKVVNVSKTAMLKLYTIYSPPNHPDGTVHKTKAEAEAAESLEPIKTHGHLCQSSEYC